MAARAVAAGVRAALARGAGAAPRPAPAAHVAARLLSSRTAPAAAAAADVLPLAAGTAAGADAAELFARVKHLHESVLKPLNTRVLGPLEKAAEEMIPLPMVFILGNHSSGKSSFINYVTGRQVQATGVAPTDDTFTCIAPGSGDVDQDGPALVGDPGLGFRGLRQYGVSLINHLQLKVRTGLALQNIMLVDSPGMIDAPVTPAAAAAAAGGDKSAPFRDRGYDFAGVVRWFAERADIILLFQDPAKPGTTGETLNIMTTALAGQDYKTFIILNKADQFSTVHDFARAYGALCWNLSKVIPRKDLPRIYTMCVPVANPSSESGAGAPAGVLKDAMPDLENTRAEIIREVNRAPLRRIDNLITRLYDSARLLKMHATVLNAVKREFTLEMAKTYGAVAAAALGAGTVAGTLLLTGAWELGAPLAGLSIVATVGGSWYAQRYLGRCATYYIHGPGLEEAFRRSHFMQLAEKDEFVLQLWDRVRPGLQNCLQTLGIRAAPSVKRSDLAALDSVIDGDVPALRKGATKASSISTLSGFFSAITKQAAGGAAAASAAAAAAAAPPPSPPLK